MDLEWGPPFHRNPSYTSPDHRYWAIVRMYPGIDDFEEVLVDVYNAVPHEKPQETILAFYEYMPSGAMRTIATWELKSKADDLLVSSSGDRIIALGRCLNPRHRNAQGLLLAIYDAQGNIIRSVYPSDLFSTTELQTLKRDMNLLIVGVQGDKVRVTVYHRDLTIRLDATDGDPLDPDCGDRIVRWVSEP
jgi:hypothetical protein